VPKRGSLVGAQDAPDFCAARAIVFDGGLIRSDEVNAAYERLLKSNAFSA
jgi:D-arabinose 1-dehydrogenase-like Zn-dependent alcohol dehydrogenase